MEAIKMENRLFSISFDKQTARVSSFFDKAAGYEFIRGDHGSEPAFRISLINEDPRLTESFCSTDASGVSFSQSGGALAIAFEFGNEFLRNVTVTVSLPEGDPTSHWSFEAACAEGWFVEALECPIIPGVLVPGQTEKDKIAFPCLGEGYLYSDPFPLIDGIPVKSGTGGDRYMEGPGRLSMRSPGNMSLQFMLCYNDVSGLYMAAYDNEGCVKDFEIKPDETKKNISMSVKHFPQKGDRVRYETVAGVFRGDWHDGADIYKEWARRQYWAQSPMETRPQPEWMRSGFAVFQMGNYGIPTLNVWNSMEDIADYVNDVSDRAKTPMAGLVFNYERAGGWTGPAGIFPPRDAGFEKAMRDMDAHGNHGFVYIPFGMWYADIPYSEPFDSMKEMYDQASHYAIRDKYDDVQINKWVRYDWRSVSLCPDGEGLYKVTADTVEELERLGCKMVQFDNWPIIPSTPCYASGHVHPKGYGQWWAQDYLRIMKKINDDLTARGSEVAITTECITEPFLHTMHMYDQRAGNMEFFGHWMAGMPAGASLIPLFNYIYNPCVGSYLAAYPECGLPDTTYWIRSTAKSVCQGVIPASGFYVGKVKTVNKACLDYFIKVAGISSGLLWKYIMYGELLREPETDAGKVKMPYFTLIAPGYEVGHLDYERTSDIQFVTDNKIEAASFSYGGRSAHVFMNITQEKVSCLASIKTLAEGTALARYIDGAPAGEFAYSSDFPLEIDGLGVIVYETQ